MNIENDKKYYERMQNIAYENAVYSNKRLDILVIAISGGSLYIILRVSKYLIEDDKSQLNYLLITSGILFVISIIINLIGQYCSAKANNFDSQRYSCHVQICEMFEQSSSRHLNWSIKSDLEDKIKKFDQKSDNYNKWVISLNYIGLLITVVALILMTISILTIFLEA